MTPFDPLQSGEPKYLNIQLPRKQERKTSEKPARESPEFSKTGVNANHQKERGSVFGAVPENTKEINENLQLRIVLSENDKSKV